MSAYKEQALPDAIASTPKTSMKLTDICIILSGYTEVNTITEAINRGEEVYKFLTNPWEDEQLRHTIGEAFVRYETRTFQKIE